ncbi:D-alanyl-D-alanine carboxypeptidase family protein [Ruminiclostridium cellulolyticum]|uniref:serine-type D-Ala-D-Ala carboxypeptidase n=1 Tax=Ruminiclostridium cellulolyticum (strain ATCC 35319 / DSM 5812 / JCM 6584 / H10) TaxID=394503 RepID=B8I6H7_RUMCH|nr:peptidase S11 D-alanyl-D-alanine carboxypeptidase 1 [Ruminiclostridium cellulolyticum H10]
MKKTARVVLIVLIILSNLLCANMVKGDDTNDDGPITNDILKSESWEVAGNQAPRVSAGAAIVMDVQSGRVLYEKNAYKRSSIASTTKIMTAIVALENGSDGEDVIVSKKAASIWGSRVGLKMGKIYKLGNLLNALMIRSGNDAAIAIAEHVGGSVEAFAEMMNRKAAEIGATNTNFVTPHGLDAPQHYSTPYDLALITQYALKNKKFCKIVSTKSSTFEGNPINNTNEMLSLYPGADGVKTGYTGQAGRCLVTSATHSGWRIISVVLNCSTRSVRAQSSKILLDYAFGNYKIYEYLKKGGQISQVGIHKGLSNAVGICSDKDISIPLKKDEADRIKVEYDIPKTLEAPIQKGCRIGTVNYVLDGKVLASTDVKSTATIKRKDFYYYFDRIFKTWARLVHQH